jgi:hypothetical protein
VSACLTIRWEICTVVEIPPVTFSDVKVQGADPRHRYWEYMGFRTYLTYMPDRRAEVFLRDMTAQQSLVDHLVHDMGSRKGSLTVLAGLAETTTPWRRMIGLRKCKGVVDMLPQFAARVAVLVCHGEVGEEIRGAVKDRPVGMLYANSNPNNRRRVLERFYGSADGVLIMHRDLAIDTPGAVDLSEVQDMLVVEADWRPEVNAAAVMRMHNRRQTKSQHVQFVSLQGSIDVWLQRLMKQHTRRIVTGFFEDEKTPDFIDPFSE